MHLRARIYLRIQVRLLRVSLKEVEENFSGEIRKRDCKVEGNIKKFAIFRF